MNNFSAEKTDGCVAAIKKVSEEIAALPEMRFEKIPRGSSALVIVDIVNGFIREGAMSSSDIENIIPPSVSLAEGFKSAEMPIVAFADCHKKGCAEFNSFPEHCLDGTSESELVDELKAVGGYTLIRKNSTNGFHERAFRSFIEENPNIETFVVVGDCTDICVLQFCLALKTYFNCENKRCDIIVPVSCVETYDAPYHNAAFMNLAAYKLMSDCGVRFVKNIR
ncbi:MAG: cysteine hydrolase [Oscillospiraceae bacterium]|nr:cysteine hydrolase [Oscillospiraceae bacterium]